MRIKTDRTNQILELLSKRQKIEVAELSQLLGVSQVTIRKDLDALEQRGIIVRVHGFAELKNSDDMGTRIAYHYDEKRKIARKAGEMVKDGDTIMIENGSCCALLADTLTESHKDITIITNSAFIASYIREKANFQIILLGGIFQPESQVMIGPMIPQMAGNFYVKLFFIGTDGYSEKTGFTNKDQLRTQAVRDMAKQAESVVVLTESEKFLQYGALPMRLEGQIKTVITDRDIPEDSRRSLAKAGVDVIVAE